MLWTAQGFGTALDDVPESITHLFGLVLNPMRGRMEEQRLIAVSEYRSEIEALLSGERVEPYRDENWNKTFRAGGLLEWFNPPTFLDRVDEWGHGIIELRRTGWQRVA